MTTDLLHKAHPLAEIFPLMDEDDLSALSEDIRTNGQRAPITLLEGRILDGRNRYRACLRAGIEPMMREFKGEDPLEFVLSANLHRRHLTESQRAMVAAKIANLDHGGNRRGQDFKMPIGILNDNSQSKAPAITTEQAAKMMKVGSRSVARARSVLADSRQANAVESGAKSVAAAEKEIKARSTPPPPDGIPRDATGYPIPAHLLPLWSRQAEVREIQALIARAISAVKTAHAAEDILWRPVNLQGVLLALRHQKRDLDLALPYAVCATCQGHGGDACLHCKGRGFLSRHLFDSTVPEEIKTLRAKNCLLAS